MNTTEESETSKKRLLCPCCGVITSREFDVRGFVDVWRCVNPRCSERTYKPYYGTEDEARKIWEERGK